MENKIFNNGVNLVRAILTNVCILDGLGLAGQAMVLDNLVDPMIRFLSELTKTVPYNGEMIDLDEYKLDEEDFVVPAELAVMAIERERAMNRLIRERVEMPRAAMARVGNTMVVAVDSIEEMLNILKGGIRSSDRGDAAKDAEFLLSNALVVIYDIWSKKELGGLHPALYNLLKLGQEACEIALSKLDGRELDHEELELQCEGYEALEAVNERLDELLMDYPEYRDEVADGDPERDVWGDEPIFPFS